MAELYIIWDSRIDLWCVMLKGKAIATFCSKEDAESYITDKGG